MKTYCRGTARIQHHTTGKTYEIDNEDLDWSAVGGDEREMGTEIHYEAALQHPDLGELIWSLWEYPLGIENYRETNVRPHTVIDDFEYGLEHDESEEWIDYAVSDNPFSIFMSSYHHTGDLLADHGQSSGKHLFNRMIFSHQITALEAYLGDTLLKEVTVDKPAMQRLISEYEDLAKQKFSLDEVAKDPGLVERKVREHLRSILYHNLAKVDVLYNIAFGIRILNLAQNRQRLFEAVSLRHDCVHRNGFDKDGIELTVFTKAFVQNTADMIRLFVEEIERAIRSRSAGIS